MPECLAEEIPGGVTLVGQGVTVVGTAEGTMPTTFTGSRSNRSHRQTIMGPVEPES